MGTLLLGTANRKKGLEMADLLGPLGIEVRTLSDFLAIRPVAEDGETFSANAAIKAAGYARQTGQWTLADDSGLAVDCLNGAPGVYSARYAGEGAGDAANNARLLSELASVPPERRSARFVCAMALADPTGTIRAQTEGYCRGQILDAPRGASGFGYDPLFLVLEYHRTFAELGLMAKSCMSHRARAARQMIPALFKLLLG